MKPDWEDAPEWAEYLAQDYSHGKWFWYSEKPYINKGYISWSCNPSSRYKYAMTSPPNLEWRETLERRPNEMARVRRIEEPAVVEATLTPVEFEIHDSSQELLAKVSMFDGESATVEIKTVVNSESWSKLSAVIQAALNDMFEE